MSQALGIEQALKIAMDAELKAKAFYAEAAQKVQEPQGRDLLGRLAAFELYHYQKLSELALSLRTDGTFIEYETQTIDRFRPLASSGEAAGTHLAELKDVPSILARAIENEKTAGERYRVLAGEAADPRGQDMFRKLAHEESIHQRILEDEFFSLSNRGVWGWSGLYGE